MSITPLHEIRDEEKLESLVESMIENGWAGNPIIVIDRGNEQQAITGSHRLEAAEISGVEIEYEEIEEPGDCNEDTARLFEMMINSDDDDRLFAIVELNKQGLVSNNIVEIMKDEILN